MLGLLAVPAMAQKECDKKCGTETFGPRKGQWQVNLVLGNYGGFYNENTTYLLPRYTNTSGSVGLPNGSSDTSGDLNRYLNIEGMNGHSLVDLGGIQIKYFFSDCWDVNVTMGLNYNATPKKDFVDGDYESVPDMIIPEQKYINAQVTNNWFVTFGTDRYFVTPNPRIQPYLGAAVGFQMGRISVSEPYTGKVYQDSEDEGDDMAEGLPEHVYLANGKVGQMFGIKAAAVADYRPAQISDQKMKKKEDQLFLELERTDDILQYLGDHKKKGQLLCGFAMETENLVSNSRAKLKKKNLDMIAANNLKVEGAGFQTDTNVLTLITQNEEVSLEKMNKEDAAGIILDKLLSL